MPRPERPLEGLGGPVEQLAAELRELRDKAGKPGYRQMAARVNYSVATLSAAASGRRLPTLEVTLAYVAACDGDREEWERRWREAERLSVAPAENPEAMNKYGPSPYPGLAMFQPGDAKLFFGRAALVEDLMRRLEQRRFLAVFGASGAGKSSVVRAGVVPAFGGPAVVLTPGAHPMAELAVQLGRHAGVPAGGLLDELREDPARAPLLVRQGLRDVPADVDLLMVVDQFEEVFASCRDAGERTDFVAALLAMCREPDGPARVVLAARADHYDRFAAYPELLAVLADSQVLIGGMSPAQLREAVTRPAEQCGARVEGALVATIVAEVGDSPGALPLAAHALREAWHRRQGAMVTLAGYQAAGGVAGAVAHTAEQAYERLSERERLVAQRVLLRMVDVGSDGLITRRRLGRTEWGTIELAPAVIEAFTAARLVSTDRDCVEITHEALIRAWPRLRGWVEESRAGLRMHRQLTEAVATWESLGRDDGALYRGLRLSTTEEAADAKIIDLSGTEREFLEASRALRDREARLRQRRTRRLFVGLVAVLSVVCVLAAVAVASARRASTERDRAVARELAAGARAERMADPDLALLLAGRAYRVHPDAETESVLRQATADARATFIMNAHRAPVAFVDVKGTQVASADRSGVIKVWDLFGRTPPVTAPFPGKEPEFGPDGRLAILRPGPQEHVVLWRPGDPGTARQLNPPFRAGGFGPDAMAYSSDGRWVAAIGADAHVHVWDTTRVGSQTRLRYTGTAQGLAFGPGGRLVLSTKERVGGAVRIWDVVETAPPVVIRHSESFPLVSMAVSPDGRRIAGAGWGRVMVWAADGRTGPRIYHSPHPEYTSVAFSPDGRRIAASTSERTVQLWNVSDATRGLTLRGHHGPVNDLAFSSDGRRLVSASDDSTVRVWDTTTAADPATVSLPTSPGMLSEDGGFTAASTTPGTISVFPTRTPQTAMTLRHGPTGKGMSLAISRGGGSVAAADTDSEQIYWWRTAAGDEPAVLECPRRPDLITPNFPAVSDDGRVLAVYCGDGGVRVWRGGDRRIAAGSKGIGSIAINRDGTLVAMSPDEPDTNEMLLWNPFAGSAPRRLKGQGGFVEHVRFSPDGRLLATASDDGAIRIWTLAGDNDPVVLTGIIGSPGALSFSPDGKLIAALGTDDTLRLWHTDGTGEALTFDYLTGAQQLAFSADGQQFITLHEANARITPCEVCGPIKDVLTLAAQRTIRDFTPQERAKYLRETG
ncbi:hypothetical protein AB0J80_10145 [Actinoplanes sp. NPDC049548]|uniref:nSTAND1 domain-containing NTPase n=1 Tax=Actinoplanes sp. NPDC049548 TaxID=3155152 RepID=UPI00342D3F81